MVVGAVIGGIARAGLSLARTGLKGGTTGSKTSDSITRLTRMTYDENKIQQYHTQNMREIDRLGTDIQEEIIKNAQKIIVLDDIEFTGNLRENIEKGVEGEFKTVDVNSPYGRFVEFGIPPGSRPNFDALRNWVEKKLGIPKDQSELVTQKISNKIVKKGISPRRYLKKAIKALIARRGVIKSSPTRRRSQAKSRFERAVNKAGRISRKVSRIANRITKYINKVSQMRKKLK